MEGRRVSSQGQKYNPLFVMFLCLVAAVIILLVISIVLGIRLSSANKKLKAAEEEVTELTATVSRLQEDLIASQSGSGLPADTGDSSGEASSAEGSEVPGQSGQSAGSGTSSSSWLDLSGHKEVKVEPSSLLSGYTDYYTTAGVNLRSGPGTNYDRITTVEYGEKVQAAAREGDWTFVKANNKFGWINSSYLSTSATSVQSSSAGSTGSSAGSTTRREATSGSLKR